MDAQRKVILMGTQERTGPELVAEEPFHVDEHAEAHRYVVRVALPGLEPAKDLDVSVDTHVLTIRAGRPSGPAAKDWPAPGYRRFFTRLTLPARANDRDVAATYRAGVLEVSIGWQDGPTERKIQVRTLSDPR